MELTTFSGPLPDEGEASRTSPLNLPLNVFAAVGELRPSGDICRAAILLTTDPTTHRVRRPAAAKSQYERAL